MTEEQHPLARRRLELDLTQEGLAEQTGVDRRTVQRWEAGERVPQLLTRNMLAKALRLTRKQLDALFTGTPGATRSGGRQADWGAAPGAGAAFREQALSGHLAQRGGERNLDDPELALAYRRQQDPAEIDDMHRREALRAFSMVGTMLALWSADSGTPAATDFDAEDYTKLNSHLWQVYALAPSKAQVLPVVRTQLGVLNTQLQCSRSLAVKRRICAAAGDLYQLKGEIHFDGNDYTAAADSYSLAAHASETAGDFDLWACAMTRHSFLSVYERRFGEAAPMLDLAAELARRGDPSLSTRHWVAVVQAETHAGLGDLAACQRALDAAEEVRALTGTIHNGGWLRFDGARLAEERGTCYASLGRHDLAEVALTDALRQKLTPRRRASVLADLAVIGAQQRDADRVISYANAVLAEARNTGSDVIRRKLTGLHRHLVPLLADKQVQRLSGEIKALTGFSSR
ncbi:helix-turn-helix transcriptional regulator [Lentzea jiangxiensis]|uniref:DNA-binding transcriptional regulator, XRE-family HTH domain n=1 Tax=Lentzea jiangxiensis TaxID=641025 RepID=A0A1H0JYZ6_9PSEU|nr:helix-turn-helix transcriptional regulator [Lentzea jiangxiensis]SDO49018.1 DNA-binding transcriptional regulator, XRE-family HTH domain [Lentzea jiangxiensis]